MMAISAIFIIPNLGKSADDQKLKNVAEELQTLIRQAQNNAQSGGMLCGTSRANYWGVQFRRISGGNKIQPYLVCGSGFSGLGDQKTFEMVAEFIIDNADTTTAAISCTTSSPVALTPLPNTSTNIFIVFSNVKGAGNFGCTDSIGTNNNCSGTPAAPCGYITSNTAPNHLLYSTAKKVTVTIKSLKTTNTKTVVVEKGGAVYVQ